MNGMIVTDKEQASMHCRLLVKNTEELTVALAEFEQGAKELTEVGVGMEKVGGIISEICRIQKQGEEAITDANNTMTQFIAEADEAVNVDIVID